MMCQNATSAVTFMYKNLGYSCTNYIDDFGGAETSTKSAAAFQALGDLLRCLGLSTSPDKDSPPATSMVFLGVLVDTTEMTISVTTVRLSCFGYHHSSKTPDYARDFTHHTTFPGHEFTISRHDMGLVAFFSAQVKLGFADNFNH